jgi:hypothetical protein
VAARANETASLQRGDTVKANDSVEMPAHRVVVRITKTLLDSLSDTKGMDRQFPVQDVILGTSVYGTVRVVGRPWARLVESNDEASFAIYFTGVATSYSTGYNGPAIVQSRAVTTFTATKQVIFEPGKGFRGKPAEVAARTDTFVEGIDSKTGGLVGRIVRRRASEIEAAQHAQVTEIVRQKFVRRIAAEFERTSQERLARMNSLTDLRSLVSAALGDGDGQIDFCCCTTPHYMQIATGGDNSVAIRLPENPAAIDSPLPPVQIWVHESLLGNRMIAATKLLSGVGKTENLLTMALTTLPQLAGQADAARMVKSAIENHQISSQTIGEWRLIEVAMPPPTTLATDSNARPAVATPSPMLSPAAETKTAPPERTARHESRPRTWTSGKYTAEAEFLALEGNIVKLRRTTGVDTSIPFEKLSRADQQWIAARLASQ